MTTIPVLRAACPTHGVQDFVRVEDCDWWECSLVGMFDKASCMSVIPDETFTPDGGEVVHLDRVRFESDGKGGERRFVWNEGR